MYSLMAQLLQPQTPDFSGLANAAIDLKQAGRTREAPRNDPMFGRGTDWNSFFGNRDANGVMNFTGGFQPVDPAARAMTEQRMQRSGVTPPPRYSMNNLLR